MIIVTAAGVATQLDAAKMNGQQSSDAFDGFLVCYREMSPEGQAELCEVIASTINALRKRHAKKMGGRCPPLGAARVGELLFRLIEHGYLKSGADGAERI